MGKFIFLGGKVTPYIFCLPARYFLAVSEYYVNHLRVSFFSFHASKTFIILLVDQMIKVCLYQ